MRLTSGMRDTLESAREFTDGRGGAVGMFPRDIGQASQMRAVLRRGLIEFYGWGRDIDGERDNDVPIYKLPMRVAPSWAAKIRALRRLGDEDGA